MLFAVFRKWVSLSKFFSAAILQWSGGKESNSKIKCIIWRCLSSQQLTYEQVSIFTGVSNYSEGLEISDVGFLSFFQYGAGNKNNNKKDQLKFH